MQQIVILAGGLGTRLGHLTAHCPKPMVTVHGKPFLEYQLALLREQGLRRIVLCIGHLGEQIRAYFGDGARFGVSIAYSEDGDSPLGTGGALKRAEPLLDDRFLMTWGDVYLLLDYQEIWQQAAANGLPATMVVYRNDHARVPSNVLVADGRVDVYDKWHPSPDFHYIDNGVSVLEKRLLERIPAGTAFAIETIFAQLAAEGQLGACETLQCYYEIGSLAGLSELSDLLANHV